MKTWLHAYAMCRSMFCAIPCPWRLWDEAAKDRMLLFLPLVGLELGVLWSALAYLARWLALPSPLIGFLLCACPFALTGGIHLDGFMDVTDAVRSWRDQERRREILKDSHVGSFAVIAVVLLIAAQLTLFASAPQSADWHILLFVPAVSRCCSALAVTCLPPMSTSQYAARRRSASHIVVLSTMLCLLITAGFLLCGRYGFALLGCAAGFALALLRAYRSLGGMNGDISGYALCLGELCAAAVYALI